MLLMIGALVLISFTTDSGSNIVKALENMDVLRLACGGHTLNLAVQKALQISQISTPLARCRKLVAHFHKSRVDTDEFKRNQSMFSYVREGIKPGMERNQLGHAPNVAPAVLYNYIIIYIFQLQVFH